MMREQILGQEHLETSESLADLTELDTIQGDQESAALLIQRALAIREQLLGPDHPDTADALEILAVVYRKKGELRQAESLHRRVLEIRRQKLGSHHPDVGKAHDFLAAVYWIEGRVEEARQQYQRAREVYSQIIILPPGEVNFSMAEEVIPIYKKIGKEREAERYERIIAFVKDKRRRYGIQPQTPEG